jgi:hypothetical protein
VSLGQHVPVVASIAIDRRAARESRAGKLARRPSNRIRASRSVPHICVDA